MNKQSASGGFRYIDITALDPVVDFVNIMTYEMDSGDTPHNALSCSRAYWDIERTYKAYMNAGATPSKMVIGIPFYGRALRTASPSALSYKSIMKLGSEYTIENWDTQSSVPYVTRNGAKYCYYDNPRSIEIKANWANQRGLGGLMYWENDQDDNNYTLRKAVWDNVHADF
jgi:chitinase